MTRTVLLLLKSRQLIANQIREFCYSYDYNKHGVRIPYLGADHH